MNTNLQNIFNKIKQDIYKNKLAIFFVFIYLFSMQILFKTWCPIKAIFNMECPGCGLTHALLYLLRGQFINAFYANYTIFLWLPLFFIFIANKYIHKFKRNIVLPLFILVTSITILRYVLNYII